MQLWRIARIVVLPAMAGILLSIAVTMFSMLPLGQAIPGFGLAAHMLSYLVLLATLYAGYRAGKAGMDPLHSALAGALTYILIVLVDNAAFLLAFGKIADPGLVLLFTAVSALLGFAGGMFARRT